MCKVNFILRLINTVCSQKKCITKVSQGSDLSVILRGLKKEQKKEISFWNKTKLFSSFLL